MENLFHPKLKKFLLKDLQEKERNLSNLSLLDVSGQTNSASCHEIIQLIDSVSSHSQQSHKVNANGLPESNPRPKGEEKAVENHVPQKSMKPFFEVPKQETPTQSSPPTKTVPFNQTQEVKRSGTNPTPTEYQRLLSNQSQQNAPLPTISSDQMKYSSVSHQLDKGIPYNQMKTSDNKQVHYYSQHEVSPVGNRSNFMYKQEARQFAANSQYFNYRPSYSQLGSNYNSGNYSESQPYFSMMGNRMAYTQQPDQRGGIYSYAPVMASNPAGYQYPYHLQGYQQQQQQQQQVPQQVEQKPCFQQMMGQGGIFMGSQKESRFGYGLNNRDPPGQQREEKPATISTYKLKSREGMRFLPANPESSYIDRNNGAYPPNSASGGPQMTMHQTHPYHQQLQQQQQRQLQQQQSHFDSHSYQLHPNYTNPYERQTSVGQASAETRVAFLKPFPSRRCPQKEAKWANLHSGVSAKLEQVKGKQTVTNQICHSGYSSMPNQEKNNHGHQGLKSNENNYIQRLSYSVPRQPNANFPSPVGKINNETQNQGMFSRSEPSKLQSPGGFSGLQPKPQPDATQIEIQRTVNSLAEIPSSGKVSSFVPLDLTVGTKDHSEVCANNPFSGIENIKMQKSCTETISCFKTQINFKNCPDGEPNSPRKESGNILANLKDKKFNFENGLSITPSKQFEMNKVANVQTNFITSTITSSGCPGNHENGIEKGEAFGAKISSSVQDEPKLNFNVQKKTYLREGIEIEPIKVINFSSHNTLDNNRKLNEAMKISSSPKLINLEQERVLKEPEDSKIKEVKETFESRNQTDAIFSSSSVKFNNHAGKFISKNELFGDNKKLKEIKSAQPALLASSQNRKRKSNSFRAQIFGKKPRMKHSRSIFRRQKLLDIIPTKSATEEAFDRLLAQTSSSDSKNLMGTTKSRHINLLEDDLKRKSHKSSSTSRPCLEKRKDCHNSFQSSSDDSDGPDNNLITMKSIVTSSKHFPHGLSSKLPRAFMERKSTSDAGHVEVDVNEKGDNKTIQDLNLSKGKKLRFRCADILAENFEEYLASTTFTTVEKSFLRVMRKRFYEVFQEYPYSDESDRYIKQNDALKALIYSYGKDLMKHDNQEAKEEKNKDKKQETKPKK